jgi:superfamily II DNA or RNA helicase
MITIEYTPVQARLVGELIPRHLADLDKLMSFQMSGAEYSDKYLMGVWDGLKHYFSVKTRKFSPGLLSVVLKYFEEINMQYELRGYPGIWRYDQSGDYKLRPHQVTCVDTMFGIPRGIIQSPPRSGKTIIASAFLDQSRLFPAIFLCNSIDIASQTLSTFKKCIPDVEFGFIGDGEFRLAPITIATVHSAIMAYEVAYKMKHIARRKAKGKAHGKGYERIGTKNELTDEQRFEFRNFFESCQTVIYDECHHSQSQIAIFLYDKIRSAKAVFGLSATPNYGRAEDMVVEATIGPVITKVTYHELIEQGFLLHPKIFMYHLPKVDVSSKVYKTIYKEALTDNMFRNLLIARIARKLNSMGKTVLIVVDELEHGRRIRSFYKDAICLYGEADLDHRNDIKDKLNRGELKCVISTLWDEGTDIPGLSFVINAAGGASPIATFQRLRSITPDPNNPKKWYGGVIDFKHKEKYLQSHCRFRREQYEGEPDFEIIDRDVHDWTQENILKEFP